MRLLRPLLTTLLLALPEALRAADAPPSAKPNILLILADDWGFGDLPSHGTPALKTPNLDRLMKEGTEFHQFTVCSGVCSPSRTAIITGQYPARYSIHSAIAEGSKNESRGMADWLTPKTTLLPRLLHDAGYATAHYGKWHLGSRGAPLPSVYGNDDTAVWNGEGRDVFEGTSFADNGKSSAGVEQAACYLSAGAAENAIRFIRAAKNKPFFVNLWLHECHQLVAATAEEKKAYPDIQEPQRTYYSTITRADRLIGEVLAELDESGVADNTLIIFTSDNGPENSQPNPGDKLYHSVGSTGGLRGRKRSLYLGGVDVPFIVRWPGHVPAGRVDKTSVISGVDMLPTLCAAAGVALPQGYHGDGVNVLPAFCGQLFLRAQPMFWEWREARARDPKDWPMHAMRDGDWALVVNEVAGRAELFNVVSDRNQEHDLAAQHPARVEAMSAAIRQWRSTLPFKPAPDCVGPRITAPKPGKNDSSKHSATSDQRARGFERMDTNKDGFLAVEEFKAGLKNGANLNQRFKNFDKSGDGKLSAEEFVHPSVQ